MRIVFALILVCVATGLGLAQSEEYDGSAGRIVAAGAPQGWFGPDRAVLYDNGPLVNSPGTGVGGADESMLESVDLGMNSLGFAVYSSGGWRVSDDFTVPSGGWDIGTITVFAYQTGSTTTSSMTGATLQILDGPPSSPARAVVWGDTVTNRMASTSWSGIYRVTETTTGLATDRPIMAVVMNVNASLPAGTYWLDWDVSGSLGSGPWAPPITINGTPNTGDAYQLNGSTWAPITDSGTMAAQGLPFIIESGAQVQEIPTLSPVFLAALLLILGALGVVVMRKVR